MAENFELSASDNEHWLNGFLQQNCEEARKRVLEERTMMNFAEDGGSQDECDLSGMFNFNEYEEFDEQRVYENIDFSILSETKRATFNGGISTSVGDTFHDLDVKPDMGIVALNGNVSIHEGENRSVHDTNDRLSTPSDDTIRYREDSDTNFSTFNTSIFKSDKRSELDANSTLSTLEDEKRLEKEVPHSKDNHSIMNVTTLDDSMLIFKDKGRHDATQDPVNSIPLIRTGTLYCDEILTKGDEPRASLDDYGKRVGNAQPPSEHAPPTTNNGELALGFETELVEVPCMGIAHPKEQLLNAINDFNKNVVEIQRVRFKQMMFQIQEIVNEILAEVERLENTFKFQRMSPESYYEMKSQNEVDILVVLENISHTEFIIEDMKTPTGFARIRMTSAYMTSLDAMRSSDVTSEPNMGSSGGTIFHWCTDTDSGEVYFSPKKLCMKFAASVSRAAAKILRRGSSPLRKKVTFSDREDTFPFVVNLIPTVACPQTWPLCAYWLRNYTKRWPSPHVKDEVVKGGMHLVAMATSQESDPLWRISFCSARRRLLQADGDGKKDCLRVLKVLLVKDLSRPKGITPLYLENIVLWASRKHWQEEEWAESMLADRFLEMLVALHKCLENKDCYNFFVPTMNLFNELKPDALKVLASKVEDILRDPFKYLKT